jgi:hypothetical protein
VHRCVLLLIFIYSGISVPMAKLLVKFCMNPELFLQDIDGNSPLDLALVANNVEVVDIFLAAGCRLYPQWFGFFYFIGA